MALHSNGHAVLREAMLCLWGPRHDMGGVVQHGMAQHGSVNQRHGRVALRSSLHPHPISSPVLNRAFTAFTKAIDSSTGTASSSEPSLTVSLHWAIVPA